MRVNNAAHSIEIVIAKGRVHAPDGVLRRTSPRGPWRARPSVARQAPAARPQSARGAAVARRHGTRSRPYDL